MLRRSAPLVYTDPVASGFLVLGVPQALEQWAGEVHLDFTLCVWPHRLQVVEQLRWPRIGVGRLHVDWYWDGHDQPVVAPGLFKGWLHQDACFLEQPFDPLPPLRRQGLIAKKLLEPVRPNAPRPALADLDRLSDRRDHLGRILLLGHGNIRLSPRP
jgi:hypothetical protein